ncbi:MAG: transcriptional regulator NrdR [Acidaminococcales bacterium]|jgi:transcriptional repressor NrdR|nr:transcriptional regulator NrdR [Acidaminococcales bacterium]
MRCPFCGNNDSKVVDSRAIDDGSVIRRRRECLICERRFTTYEKREEIPLIVVKKDGSREIFNEKKLFNGLMKAFEKRTVPVEQIKELAEKVERQVRSSGEAEISSARIGEAVMSYIAEVDQIAYVRFASVYRQFADVNNFMHELQSIIKKNSEGNP